MRQYVIRRLLLLIPTLFFLGTILFFMLRAMPGDAVLALTSSLETVGRPEEIERLREEMGFNEPLIIQYGKWMWGVVRGDLGYAPFFERSVTSALADKVEVTATLAIMAVIISLAWALPLGILSAVFRGSPLDHSIRIITAAGIALPNFWVGIMVLLLLVAVFNWMPSVMHVSLFDDPWAAMRRLIFPAMVIGFRSASVISRMTRSMMLEVLGEDYIRTARAKGLRPFVAMVRHALPNAVIPVITLAGLLFAHLIAGAVVIEQVFVIPGLGKQLVEAARARDFIMVQGVILVMGAAAMIWILVTDLIYGWVDPRIRYD